MSYPGRADATGGHRIKLTGVFPMALADQKTTSFVRDRMTDFAERTGLIGGQPPTRYLWTDAFAVCNFLELDRRTGDKTYRELALRLVDQVHHVLGRYRDDDPRQGWISGLGDAEGEHHPTKGGLRIGKALNERGPDEPIRRAPRMGPGRAVLPLLDQMDARPGARRQQSPVTQRYVRWAMELAETAVERFSYGPPVPAARRRMVWKMSIDLFAAVGRLAGPARPLGRPGDLPRAASRGQRLGWTPAGPDLDRQIAIWPSWPRVNLWPPPTPWGSAAC